jgi:hypothetical protein
MFRLVQGIFRLVKIGRVCSNIPVVVEITAIIVVEALVDNIVKGSVTKVPIADRASKDLSVRITIELFGCVCDAGFRVAKVGP